MSHLGSVIRAYCVLICCVPVQVPGGTPRNSWWGCATGS